MILNFVYEFCKSIRRWSAEEKNVVLQFWNINYDQDYNVTISNVLFTLDYYTRKALFILSRLPLNHWNGRSHLYFKSDPQKVEFYI